MAGWFYKIGEAEYGPVSVLELQFLHANYNINASTPIRATDADSWITLSQLLKSDRTGKSSNPAVSRSSSSIRNTVGNIASVESAGAPAPPPFEGSSFDDNKARQRNQLIAAAGLAGFFLLCLVLWAVWPANTGSSGAGADGNGLADQRADGSMANADHDSANHVNDTSANSEQSRSSTPAAAAAQTDQDRSATPVQVGDVDDAQSPDTAADSSLIGEAGAEAESDSSPSSTGSPVSDVAVKDGVLNPGLDLAESKVPDSRFAVTAPGAATFFGIRSSGRRFVFVVDNSGSMASGRLDRAKTELLSCLEALPRSVRYTVIFFSDNVSRLPSTESRDVLNRASRQQLQATRKWIQHISESGGTDVVLGMSNALSIDPEADVIFLLTDGEFETTTPSIIKSQNKGNARINTIAFESRSGETLLKRIAADNGGDYRFVP